MTNIDKVWIDEAEAMANSKLTDEQLDVAIEFVHNRYKAAKINGHMLMTDESIILSALIELQEYRKAEGEPVAVIRFDKYRTAPDGSKPNWNEMPEVVSCNWLPDGVYNVYLGPQPAPAVEVKPIAFFDGDISPADAEKLTAAIRELNNSPSEPAKLAAVEAVSLEVAVFTCTICGRTTTHPEGWHYCKKGNEND